MKREKEKRSKITGVRLLVADSLNPVTRAMFLLF
jgi:hypothetical protein